jgi:diguanylate cyclase (GGDEF)-like protein/PAS domain S-box-containing protein
MSSAGRGVRHRPLAIRIASGIAAMLLTCAIAVTAGAIAIRSVAGGFDREATRAIDEVVPIGNARVALGPFQYAGYEALLGLQSPSKFDATAVAMEKQIDALVNGADIPSERAALVAARAQLGAEVARFRGLISAHAVPAPALVASLHDQTTGIDNQLRAGETAAGSEVHDAARKVDGIQARSMWEYTAVALFALLVAVAVATFLIRSVGRPLRRLQQGVRRIADGDLDSRIDLSRTDELGELGDALDHMAEQLQRAKQELSHQALHDALTGLPNRNLLHDRVEQATNRVQRRDGVVALMFVDVDDFKDVNDTLGHPVGDLLLQTIATRLVAELRDVDTAARTGGDEFALLIEDLRDEAEAMAVAERIRTAISAPFDADGTVLRAHASIGVATTRDGHETVADLLRNADIAMYAAKRSGKDRSQWFVDSMHTDALERATLERALREAVLDDQLTLHYQPEIDLESGRVAGAEALIRWHHPELGMLSPARFVPLAEETGIIVPLGQWVLQEACGQLVQWQRDDPDRYCDFTMNVNVSIRQLERPSVVSEVRQALEDSGLAPRHLVLELTESMLAGGEDLLERLHELRELGVGIAVDDFGTGYSSLEYLRRFPIDVLKIDRSFVAGIANRHVDATLASTIIELGRMLGLTTVAEGIEEEDQLELLRQLGCSLGQGFLFARPLPADELARLVADTPVFELPELPYVASLPEPSVPQPMAEVPQGIVGALLQHATDGLALFDADGTLLYVSAASRRLGYEPEEMIGMNALELVHPQDLPGVAEAFVTTLATPGQKRPLALRLRGADGEWVPVELVSNNMLDEPSVRGVVVVIRDMRLQGISAIENAAAAADEAA